MSYCGVSYQKTMNSTKIESELNWLQKKFELNIQALDTLFYNYNTKLMNLNELVQKDVHQCIQVKSSNLQKPQPKVAIATKSKVPPEPPPKNLKLKCNGMTKELIPKQDDSHDFKELLRRLSPTLINYISCTLDIAARLFQEKHLTQSELEAIQETRSLTKANEILLNILLKKPVQTYRCFLDELQRTRQGHVLSLFTKTGDNLCDSFLHQKLIRQHYVTLTESIDVEDSGLLSHLVAENVLTERERVEIGAEWNRYRQTECLLAIICRKSPEEFDTFLKALCDTNQKHIGDLLQGLTEAQSCLEMEFQKKTIISKCQSEKADDLKNTNMTKRRLHNSEWITKDNVSLSIRLDISSKVLAIRHSIRKSLSNDDDERHINNLRQGVVELRKTALLLNSEKNESLERNLVISAQKEDCESQLKIVQKNLGELQTELNCKTFEIFKLKIQSNEAMNKVEQLEDKLQKTEIASEISNRKLAEVVCELKKRKEIVLESTEYKSIREDKDRLEIKWKNTEKELEKQRALCSKAKIKEDKSQQIHKETGTKMEALRRETEAKLLQFSENAEKDKKELEDLKKEISRLKDNVNQLHQEKHLLINELNVEREKNLKKKKVPTATLR